MEPTPHRGKTWLPTLGFSRSRKVPSSYELCLEEGDFTIAKPTQYSLVSLYHLGGTSPCLLDVIKEGTLSADKLFIGAHSQVFVFEQGCLRVQELRVVSDRPHRRSLLDIRGEASLGSAFLGDFSGISISSSLGVVEMERVVYEGKGESYAYLWLSGRVVLGDVGEVGQENCIAVFLASTLSLTVKGTIHVESLEVESLGCSFYVDGETILAWRKACYATSQTFFDVFSVKEIDSCDQTLVLEALELGLRQYDPLHPFALSWIEQEGYQKLRIAPMSERSNQPPPTTASLGLMDLAGKLSR